MVRVQILTPFRLQFRSKDIWLTAHENYYLDVSKEAEREELKFILSALFPYRDFIYIDESQLDLKLLSEVHEEGGFTQVGEPYEMPQPDSPSIVVDNLIAPIRDPEPNRFVDSNVSVQVPVTLEEEVLEPAIDPEPQVEELPIEKDNNQDRAAELNAMNYKKIKEIADEYGIEYTNKAETIEAILIMES